jgi:hypothetical protein
MADGKASKAGVSGDRLRSQKYSKNNWRIFVRKAGMRVSTKGDIYSFLRALFHKVGQNKKYYKKDLEKAQKLPEDQREKAERELYKEALETHQKILDWFRRYYSPRQTAAGINDYLADIGRDMLIAMVLDPLRDPLPPDTVLGRDQEDQDDWEKFLDELEKLDELDKLEELENG